MDSGAPMMVVALALAFGSLGFVIFSTVRSIMVNRRGHGGKGIWREFGLGLALMILFLATWVGHGIAQWQKFTDNAREHSQPVELGDFASDFGATTLENWQSEFLQLFAFVTLAALFVHRGSAESKDSEERIEASLHRIETQLGTIPPEVVRLGELPDPPNK